MEENFVTTFCYNKNNVGDTYFRQNFSQRVDADVKDVNYKNNNNTKKTLKT